MRLGLLAFLLSALSFSAPQKFEIRDMSQRNTLAVISDSSLERVVAVASLLWGWVEVDLSNLGAGIRGELEVDLRSLDTRIDVRNSILREKILETPQYPLAQVSFMKWAEPVTGSLGEGQPANHKVEATLKYRGRTTALQVPLRLAYFKEGEWTKQRLPGNLLRLSTKFTQDIMALGITIPDSLKAIVARTVEISIDAVGSDKLPTGFSPLPEGPKAKEP